LPAPAVPADQSMPAQEPGTRPQRPLPYQANATSIADVANGSSSRYAGAITAALYLKRFVPDSTAWMHLDVYAWNDSDRPGRPHGGEAQGLRAFFAMLKERYR